MSAIGILGGMGPQASSRLLELLINGTKVLRPDAIDSDFPEIVLLSVPVPNFVSNKNNINEARSILIEKAKLLATAGCKINAIACNTAHILLPDIQAETNLLFLSIPKLVAMKVNANGFHRVGLLATPTTLSSTLYDNAIGDDAILIRPNALVAKNVEKYIFKQLNSDLSETEQVKFLSLVENFKLQQNLDAVILGCTELPLVFGFSRDPTILDTLQILADALLAEYFNVD